MASTRRRKLLTAALGVGTVSYVIACGGMGGGETSGNLVSPGGRGSVAGQGGSGQGGSGGNIGDSGTSGYGGAETSGNLVAAGGTTPAPDQGGSGGVPGARDAGASDAAAEPGDAAVDSGP